MANSYKSSQRTSLKAPRNVDEIQEFLDETINQFETGAANLAVTSQRASLMGKKMQATIIRHRLGNNLKPKVEPELLSA